MNKTKNEKIKNSIIATRQKRRNQQCEVFELKVQHNKLNKTQQEKIKMMFVEAKWLINDILGWSQIDENKPWNYKLNKTVTKLNKNKELETVEFKFLPASMRQTTHAQMISNIRSLSTLKNRGHKIGRLKFKSECTLIELKQYKVTHKIVNKNKIQIQGLGKIKVSGLEQVIDKGYEFANAKLLNKPNGYFIKLTCFKNKEQKTYDKDEIDIDFGISNTITLSDGRKFKTSIGESERLKRLQRQMSRRQKGSNNRRKTIRKIKIEYQKLNNKKNDLANKIIHEIKQYKHIFMQDENLKGWHKGLFGKQVQHSCLGRIKSKLTKEAYVLDRFIPTTRFCYNCGQIHDKVELSQRVFECDCGLIEDRDIHAAKNMIYLVKLDQKLKSVPVERRDLDRNIEKPVER